MINATQAKEISKAKVTQTDNAILLEIEKRIKLATERGHFNISLDAEPSLGVKSELEKLGYKYSHYSDQRDGDSYTTISWV